MHSTRSKTKPKHSVQFEALGTAWSIESDDEISKDLETEILAAIDRFDQTWSRFRRDSMVVQMNSAPGEYPLDQTGVKLLKWYRQLYDMTNGLVTPLIGQTIADSGYDHQYSLRANDSITQTRDWDQQLSLNGSVLHASQPCLLDVGAAGKGAAVDVIAEIMKQHNHRQFTVDGSGDIYTTKHEVIGLEHPFDPSKIIGTATIQNKSICGSASNKRTWGDGLHHIIDPMTSKPTNDVIATWAIADTTMKADGIATALFFVAPEILLQQVAFDYIIIHKDGKIAYSKHKDITIFTL